MAAPSTVPGDSRVVYFGNLSFDANEADVADFAGRAGRVESTNYRRRYAHVTFATAAEADAAVAQLNGVALKGREVRAEKSRPLEERPPREARAPRLDPATGEVKTYDRRIVVRGLPRETTSEELQAVFAPLGTVLKARLGGGLGRVSFETDEAAAAALGKTGTVVSGATITVEKERMRPRRKRAPRHDGDDAAPAAGGAGAGGEPRPAPARKPRVPRADGGAGTAPRAPAAPRTTAPAAPRVAAPPRRVRVAGLAGMTPDMLRSLFTSIGPIAAAKVIAGKDVGFVTFEKAEDATKATTLSGTTISGITISIEMDVRAPRAPRPAGDAPAAGGAGAPRPPREPREARPPREVRPPREPRDLTNTLWVTGFPAAQMTTEFLQGEFGRYGTVQAVTLLGGGRSAYIKYDNDAAIDPAISAWNGKTPAGTDFEVKAERASGAAPRRPRYAEGAEGAPAGGAGGEGAARRPRRRGPRRDGGAPAGTA